MPENVTVLHDQTYQGASVLANDIDTGPGPLTAELLTGTQHGSTLLNSDGTFWYTPVPGYIGTDQFTYQATDGAASDWTSVSIAVYDNAPTANSFSVSTPENTMASIPVLANSSDPDGDTLTPSIVTGPQNGMGWVNFDGTIGYMPSPGYAGTVSLTYKVNDGAMDSNTAMVTIAVMGPVANDETFTVTADSSATSLDVLADDTDPQGNPLTPIIVQGPQNGSACVSNGAIWYTANSGFSGTDTLTYEDYDGSAYSNVATVTVNVTPAPPVAVDATFTVAAGSQADNLNVLLNDTDSDGLPLTPTIVSAPANGSAAVVKGMIVYTPTSGFTGTDTFEYEDFDGSQYSNVATDSVFVVDAPAATQDIWTDATGDGLWSTAGNWSGGSVPDVTDIAVFQAPVNGVGTNDNCTFDNSVQGANQTIAGIQTQNSYAGTLNLNATNGSTLTVENTNSTAGAGLQWNSGGISFGTPSARSSSMPAVQHGEAAPSAATTRCREISTCKIMRRCRSPEAFQPSGPTSSLDRMEPAAPL